MYRRGRKRSRKEFDLEDLDDLDSRPQKRSKTMEPQLTLDSEGFNFGLCQILPVNNTFGNPEFFGQTIHHAYWPYVLGRNI